MKNNKFPGQASGREFQNPVQAEMGSVPEVPPKGEGKALENQCDRALGGRASVLPEVSAGGSQERLISWFRAPVSNTVPGGVMSLQEVYQQIKSPLYAAVTNQLRGIGDKKQRREFKARHFDYVTFGGVFGSRRNSALLQPSYMAVFDFDELGEALSRVREQLKQDELLPTQLLFTSPSGNGLKWVVRYEPQVCGYPEFFRGVSHYLHKRYGLTPDSSGSDIARACFLCHDPEVFTGTLGNQSAVNQQPVSEEPAAANSPQQLVTGTGNRQQLGAASNGHQAAAGSHGLSATAHSSLQPTATSPTITNNNKL